MEMVYCYVNPKFIQRIRSDNEQESSMALVNQNNFTGNFKKIYSTT